MDKRIAVAKILLFVLCLIPAASLVLDGWRDALGEDPVDTFTRGLGNWTLYFLLITLAVTPLRRFTRMAWLGRLRRMLGLFGFAYAGAHLTAYLWLGQAFGWADIGLDITKHPFIVAGMFAFALLVPLAVTSSGAMVRRLGGKRWQDLHRLIYPAAMLGVLHYTWMAKAGTGQPMLLGVILAGLLGLRLWWWFADARKPLLEQRRRIIQIQVRR